jgi:hypothetical protein
MFYKDIINYIKFILNFRLFFTYKYFWGFRSCKVNKECKNIKVRFVRVMVMFIYQIIMGLIGNQFPFKLIIIILVLIQYLYLLLENINLLYLQVLPTVIVYIHQIIMGYLAHGLLKQFPFKVVIILFYQ